MQSNLNTVESISQSASSSYFSRITDNQNRNDITLQIVQINPRCLLRTQSFCIEGLTRQAQAPVERK